VHPSQNRGRSIGADRDKAEGDGAEAGADGGEGRTGRSEGVDGGFID
jgi:hypothetical protein